jgi:hypothetical protein
MTLLRFWLVLALAIGSGCTAGGPQRASDIQNPNAIADDISAVNMTHTDGSRIHDPNEHSTLPRTYEISDTQ